MTAARVATRVATGRLSGVAGPAFAAMTAAVWLSKRLSDFHRRNMQRQPVDGGVWVSAFPPYGPPPHIDPWLSGCPRTKRRCE
jgi:hypothetical protein